MRKDIRACCIAYLALSLLLGCEAKYKNVSKEVPYSKYLGQVCEVTKQLEAHGIAVNHERAKGTDYVMVQEPLARRYYTTFVYAIRPGEKFTILSVRKCANCPFDDYTDFGVTFGSEPDVFDGKPVYLRTFDELETVASCGQVQDAA